MWNAQWENVSQCYSCGIFVRSPSEIVANSIDSYREIRGAQNIGKFDMGFFSLLFWLNYSTTYIMVKSVYDTGVGLCSWKCYITWNEDDDEYYFTVSENVFGLDKIHKTGTTIVLGNIRTNNIIYIKDFGRELKLSLLKSFSQIKDVSINMKYDLFGEISEYNINDHAVDRSLVYVKTGKDRFGDYSTATFIDEAKGIPINVLLTKLLLPAISTKTLANFEICHYISSFQV